MITFSHFSWWKYLCKVLIWACSSNRQGPVFFPLFPDAVSLRGAFPYKTKHCEWGLPLLSLLPQYMSVYIKSWYPFSVTHSCSLEVFIFSRQGKVSRELWCVNSCDPSQVSHRPRRGLTVWWCLKRRRWKGISQSGSGQYTGVFMETNFHNNLKDHMRAV